MAFDVMTGSVILFGGAATINGTPLAETWRWNGNTWTLLQPPSSPPALVAHAMTTHLGSGQIVLFGGRNVSGQEQAQTWTFDGFTWTQLTGPQPPARCCHDLVYDVARAVVVLYGGWSGINYGDTWELGPFGWTQRFPPASPTARWGHRFAAAPSLNGVVMHGGTLGSLPGNETWLWDGTTWQQIAVGTSPTQVNHVMHRHWAFGRVVLFGGVTTNWAASNETWTLGTTSPASFAPFGAGCAGPGGAPALFPSAAPWIGTTATASMSPVPALGVFVVGFSNTVSGGLPLPASLAPIGMPGCSLYVSLDVLLAAVPTGVVATLSIPLPFQPALVGQQFFVQGASFDPGANPMGLTVSNALAATIGWL
jgi:hypothetical protein